MIPAIGSLRELAEAQGVSPTDEDLEVARSLLEFIFPELAKLDAMLEREEEL